MSTLQNKNKLFNLLNFHFKICLDYFFLTFQWVGKSGGGLSNKIKRVIIIYLQGLKFNFQSREPRDFRSKMSFCTCSSLHQKKMPGAISYPLGNKWIRVAPLNTVISGSLQNVFELPRHFGMRVLPPGANWWGASKLVLRKRYMAIIWHLEL